MLIITGTAENMSDNNDWVKGDRYEFNLFSSDENFDDRLDVFDKFLMSKGWDNIEVENTGIIADSADIEHDILKQAFDKASQEGLAVVVTTDAIT